MMSTLGRMATAPAIETRFFWPKLSMWVGLSPRCEISSASSAAVTRARVSAVESPRLNGPNDTSCATLPAKSWSSGFWNTSPTT